MDKTRHFFVVLWLILICVAVTLTAYFISLAIYEQDGSKALGVPFFLIAILNAVNELWKLLK